MALETRILVWTWTEPEAGCDAAAFTTRDVWWEAVERAVAWLRRNAGKEWGCSVPSVTVVPAPHARSAPCKLDHVLGAIARRSGRVSGEFPRTATFDEAATGAAKVG